MVAYEPAAPPTHPVPLGSFLVGPLVRGQDPAETGVSRIVFLGVLAGYPPVEEEQNGEHGLVDVAVADALVD